MGPKKKKGEDITPPKEPPYTVSFPIKDSSVSDEEDFPVLPWMGSHNPNHDKPMGQDPILECGDEYLY